MYDKHYRCTFSKVFFEHLKSYVLPRFDPISSPSKLSFLLIDLKFLLHTLSALIMTRLFQLDVPEEHWHGFVDIVQN